MSLLQADGPGGECARVGEYSRQNCTVATKIEYTTLESTVEVGTDMALVVASAEFLDVLPTSENMASMSQVAMSS